jgi:SecD/SecF fusion protein
MDKQRKWHLFAILSVIALTIYNILPTVFYYAQPLKQPIDASSAKEISASIEERVNALEKKSCDWIHSFCKLLKITPKSVDLDPLNPQFIKISFVTSEEAAQFRLFFPRAASSISFEPEQLFLTESMREGKEIVVQRQIPVHLESQFFSFYPKNNQEILNDRVEQLCLALAGTSEIAAHLARAELRTSPYFVESLASEINSLSQMFPEDHPIAARYAAQWTQGPFPNRSAVIESLLQSFDALRDDLKREQKEQADAKERSEEKEPSLQLLEKRQTNLIRAKNYLKAHIASFSSGSDPLRLNSFQRQGSYSLDLAKRNPLFSHLVVDPSKDQIVLKFHPDVISFRKTGKNKELFEKFILNEIAKISRLSNEKLVSKEDEIAIPLSHFPNASGFLALDLKKLAQVQIQQFQSALTSLWHPKHPDLQNLQIVDCAAYEQLKEEEKGLCLIVASPLCQMGAATAHLHNPSLYLIGKGLHRISKNHEAFPNSERAAALRSDLQSLDRIARQNGFTPASGIAPLGDLVRFEDAVFEKQEWLSPLIAATRENFVVRGTQRCALLEVSNREQRILTQNKIETAIHEELLKWADDYQAAQVSMNPKARLDIPRPVESPFWSNLKLSLRKLMRGDEKKIIRWGLDLSGGKTVQIELRDPNHRLVTEEADLRQGINELYARINKMGLSEVSIRQVGTHIVLDFPSSQELSASDLIQASSMYFHVVNEKFSSMHSDLFPIANQFLKEVWNEASLLEKKDSRAIHAIAYERLHEEALRSEAAKTLWDNGLRLAAPQEAAASNALDTSLSKIAVLRGSDRNGWHGQAHPLLIVFHNYALEGSNLENIQASYDQSKGNYLNFEVRSAYQTREGQSVHPRNSLFSWTSTFAKENIAGTALENDSKGRGWRMAVLLNDSVISAPTLDSTLTTGGAISGSFSQREVNQLASDLKAGSLTFTPHILSEKNVSPELGQKDRIQGISATCIALLLVVCTMIAYYRFAGIVASVAVLFNLLILWATLQNLNATLTLAGLAGVILTVGMAVDANVLVFERIKEEFARSGRIGSALSVGYKKAYSAIIDSNITTIIAAIILLNFDAGPIKSFAINLIIGIVSSMFTALFMTRFYFTRWIQNPKNKELKMADWIRGSQFNFLTHSRAAILFSSLVIVVGGFLVVQKKSSIFGLDFTGGYAVNLELESAPEGNYLQRAEKALLAAGAAPSDFQIRELHPENHLRALFGTAMEQSGRPFFKLPLQMDLPEAQFGFEKNPRLQWIVQALQKEHLTLSSDSLAQLESHWTAMSGQISSTMRDHALYGLLISFLCIFIYLSFRFEYQFAAAALICLFHDVFITLGAIGLLHTIGVPVQIDLNTVAALMTIVGYSLNDTIIIFDRIREELLEKKQESFGKVVNHALNATLSRTTMTSGTTLLVLVALVAFGGSSIFSFALVMAIGVFFGTLSSWFIASPLLLFFQKKEAAKELATKPF